MVPPVVRRSACSRCRLPRGRLSVTAWSGARRPISAARCAMRPRPRWSWSPRRSRCRFRKRWRLRQTLDVRSASNPRRSFSIAAARRTFPARDVMKLKEHLRAHGNASEADISGESRRANSSAHYAKKALAQLRAETSAPMIELPLLHGVSGGELVRAIAREFSSRRPPRLVCTHRQPRILRGKNPVCAVKVIKMTPILHLGDGISELCAPPWRLRG